MGLLYRCKSIAMTAGFVTIVVVAAFAGEASADERFEFGAGYGARLLPSNGDVDFGVQDDTQAGWSVHFSGRLSDRFGAGLAFTSYGSDVFVEKIIDPDDAAEEFMQAQWNVTFFAPYGYAALPVGDSGAELRARAGLAIGLADVEAQSALSVETTNSETTLGAYVGGELTQPLYDRMLSFFAVEQYFGSTELKGFGDAGGNVTTGIFLISAGLGYRF